MPYTWLLWRWQKLNDQNREEEKQNEVDKFENVNRIIEKLSLWLDEPIMKSSTRLLIIIALYLNDYLTFTELLQIVHVGKGSLMNHLGKMQEKQIVKIKKVFSPAVPRTVIELSDLGRDIFKEYSKLMIQILKSDS